MGRCPLSMTPLEKTELLEGILKDVYNHFDAKLSKFGDVFIAGGACRDTLLGVEPKDYDIFLINTTDRPVDVEYKVGKIIADTNAYKELKIVDREYDKPACANFKYADLQIQIIVRKEKTVDELLRDFDLNVCMVAYGHTEDGPVDYIFHEKFPDLNKLKKKSFLITVENCRNPLAVIQRLCYMSKKMGVEVMNNELRNVAREICIEYGEIPKEKSAYKKDNDKRSFKEKIVGMFAKTTSWGS